MNLGLSHHIDDAVEVRAGGVTLLRYVYRPDDPEREAPKPYLHPVRTLAGHLVTGYRPHDHVWHKGIAMTCSHVDEDDAAHNFWGGPTFRDGDYVYLDNCGRIRHDAWQRLAVDEGAVQLAHRLSWLSAAGETLVAEERALSVEEVDPAAGTYAIDVTIRLRNVAGRSLSFGSPTTHGRPKAGYGGLFWRGPRAFQGGRVLSSGAEGGEAVIGTRGEWLAFVGRHDEVDAESTLLFVDHPASARYPTTWFVRSEPIPAASFAFAFDEELPLPPGEALQLRHRIVVADGAWERDRIEAYMSALRTRWAALTDEPAAATARREEDP